MLHTVAAVHACNFIDSISCRKSQQHQRSLITYRIQDTWFCLLITEYVE